VQEVKQRTKYSTTLRTWYW